MITKNYTASTIFEDSGINLIVFVVQAPETSTDVAFPTRPTSTSTTTTTTEHEMHVPIPTKPSMHETAVSTGVSSKKTPKCFHLKLLRHNLSGLK